MDKIREQLKKIYEISKESKDIFVEIFELKNMMNDEILLEVTDMIKETVDDYVLSKYILSILFDKNKKRDFYYGVLIRRFNKYISRFGFQLIPLPPFLMFTTKYMLLNFILYAVYYGTMPFWMIIYAFFWFLILLPLNAFKSMRTDFREFKNRIRSKRKEK